MKRREITFEMVTTKGGDMGETSLYNGERRRKDDLVMDVVGDLDELGAFLGMARAVCRRAERHMVSLIRERGYTYLATGQRYLNRLSDLLFIIARSLETL
ncbi:MAG: ATP:cob(I)alamin adenosyltransferase [Spirochaetia bacterium]|jgi:cob(I)alamin adenosyltransferase|nr:ATP:cob(I)alamin adenosyltransferase [Spirochaetia bacterium]